MSFKKVKLESQGQGEGHDYFQSLPDEILIVIFTKLSSGDGHDTIQDIKLLAQCSTISKRFNSLTSLVPSLHITHPFIMTLFNICPQILNKFKHITSLRVKYEPGARCIDHSSTNLPYIYAKATYKPHNYCLSVVTFTDIYLNPCQQQQHYPTHTAKNLTAEEQKLCVATDCYAGFLFKLHHRLVSSIWDHKRLQMVVVSDCHGRESFTLVDKQLVELRTVRSPELAQVQGLHRRGFCDILDLLPFTAGKDGLVFKNMSFSIFHNWENSTGPDDDIPRLEGKGKRAVQSALELMLKMKTDIISDYKMIRKLMSDWEWY